MPKFIVACIMFVSLVARGGEFNTQMLLNTFKITSPECSGSVFILTRPTPGAPDKPQTILVTAAHVLANMKGEEATLNLRKKIAEGEYEKMPFKMRIKEDGKVVWKKHPAEDVAAMIVTLPPDAERPALSIDVLATDEALTAAGVHPGDTLRCVGYPHASQFESGKAGFPVIRIGCIASFPLLPTEKTKRFLADFNTFEGDSGAPLYMTPERGANGPSMLIGLVHGQHFLDENFKNIYESGQTKHRLGLAIVVHASIIRATIDMLP